MLQFLNSGIIFFLFPFQFICLKFINDDDRDPEAASYAVGLRKWLVSEPDTKMICQTRWPPSNIDSEKLVRKQAAFQNQWEVHTVVIKKFYGE